MNKQEAIHYIHQMLEQDHAQDEIARLLAAQLHAPQDVVIKFVTQTAADYREQKARQAEESAPVWLRELRSSATAPSEPTPLADKTLPQATDAIPRIKLPPWLQEGGSTQIPSYESAPSSPTWREENRDYVLQQLEMRRTYGDIADGLAARTGITPSAARHFVREIDTLRRSLGKNAQPEHQQTPIPAPAQADIPLKQANVPVKIAAPRDPLKDTALNEFVLDALGRQRRRSDVVMAVCEQGNVSWDEAERIVAQASIQKHSQGAVQTSEVLLLIGLLVTVVGFLLSALYGLPLLAILSTQVGLLLRLPFNGEFATRSPALGILLFVSGLLLVGVGAAVAYLFYHAAEEQEA